MNENTTEGVTFDLLCPLDKTWCTTMCAAFRCVAEGNFCNLKMRTTVPAIGYCTLFNSSLSACAYYKKEDGRPGGTDVDGLRADAAASEFVDESRARGIELKGWVIA